MKDQTIHNVFRKRHQPTVKCFSFENESHEDKHKKKYTDLDSNVSLRMIQREGYKLLGRVALKRPLVSIKNRNTGNILQPFLDETFFL